MTASLLVGNEALRGLVGRLVDPHLRDAVVGAVVGEPDGIGDVEIGGPVLHHLQRVPAAGAHSFITVNFWPCRRRP